ncbi:hypothetical protein [Rhizobium sp. AAP43]|uniref:hypothetical protein n=1 Tax=Rhizobium sp. AAP43 TaxID=1523420 RepID=UPI0006B8E5B7|nr:hypothetical protein [Rhizobium sp. AAP43]KPF47277.1 hypothetical protein IP76_00465 [Rhizobium sp. AAP43]
MIAFLLEQLSPFVWVAAPTSIGFYVYLFLSKPVIRDGAIRNSELYAAMFMAPLLALVTSRLIGPPFPSFMLFIIAYGLTLFFVSLLFVIALIRGRHILKTYDEYDYVVTILVICAFCFFDYLNSYSGQLHCTGSRCQTFAPVFGYPHQVNFISFAVGVAFSGNLTVLFVKIALYFRKGEP